MEVAEDGGQSSQQIFYMPSKLLMSSEIFSYDSKPLGNLEYVEDLKA